MTMTIKYDQDSLTLDRRCIAAHYNGELPQLVVELRHAGVETSEEELKLRAQNMAEVFSVGCASRATCYLCGAMVDPHGICVCYDEVRTMRHVNVNSTKVLLDLPPTFVVERFCCTSCGDITAVTAEAAISSHEKNGEFRPRKFCRPCFKARTTKPRRKAKAAKQNNHVDLLSLAQQQVSSGQA